MKSATCILRRVPNLRAQVGMEYEEFVSQIQLMEDGGNGKIT
jgi:hypothetical protein